MIIKDRARRWRAGSAGTAGAERHQSAQRTSFRAANDDHPFIVLTETKFSFCCILVGIGTLLT